MHMISLPLEILEEIASLIDLHYDLVSLALACKVWNRLLIPSHTEYRIIRVRQGMPSMWAHLARRSDLARNIREIHLCEPSDTTLSDRYPTTLVYGQRPRVMMPPKEDQRIAHMCEALMHMKRLEEFNWSWNWQSKLPTVKSVHEAQIFNALSHCKSLRRLRLSGPFGEHAMGVDRDPEGVFYPLWNVGNLEALALEGKAWVRPQVAPHVRAMLSRSPNLHTLLFPLEFPFLSTPSPADNRTSPPIFPHLHTLKLALQTGASTSIDARMLSFLSLHPTITDLEWFPLNGSINLPPGILPQLKRLVTYARVGSSLRGILNLGGGSPGRETLDCLSQISVYKEDLDALEQELDAPARLEDSPVPGAPAKDEHTNNGISISKSFPTPECKLHLKKLKIHFYDSIESVTRLGALFPELNWLFVETHCSKPSWEAILSLINSFPKLTTFLGGNLFDTTFIRQTKYTPAEMDSVIQRIAQAAPRLREVDYWEPDSSSEHDAVGWTYWRVVILRDGGVVTWEQKSVEACRAWFDPLAQHFN